MATEHVCKLSRLDEAYRLLQLEPDNVQRKNAFQAFCWRHVLSYILPEWLQRIRTGEYPLNTRMYRANPDHPGNLRAQPTIGFEKYDETLETIIYEFMRRDAKVIWPSRTSKRSHLRDPTNRHGPFRATNSRTRAEPATIRTLTQQRQVFATEDMIVTEPYIGRKVRAFFMELLLGPIVGSDLSMSPEQLLFDFLGMQHPVNSAEPGEDACLEPGCELKFESWHSLEVHQHMTHDLARLMAPSTDLTIRDGEDPWNIDWSPPMATADVQETPFFRSTRAATAR